MAALGSPFNSRHAGEEGFVFATAWRPLPESPYTVSPGSGTGHEFGYFTSRVCCSGKA
jgi:hypothetical protein